MRELTKSVMRLSWALPLFAVRQAANLATPGDWIKPTRATEAFEAVSAAAESQLGDTLHQAFALGDQVQRGVVDFVFGMVAFGGGEGDSAAGSSTAGR